MAGLGTGAPIVKVYHEKSMILPDVSRVLACLYEKEIDFRRETFSSYKSLLRLQALSHVPVPFYDGPNKFLEESREICHHIAETYEDHGYPFLLGKDSLERASIEEWLHHEQHNFNPPSRSLFCHLAFPVAEEDDDIDLQMRKLEEVLEVYEQRLGDSEFLAGNKFTLADLVHLPNSYHIRNSEKFLYLYDSRKNVQRWWHAISNRGSWQKVLEVMHEVEQQNKQEELEKQQQHKQEELEKQQRRRWRREYRTTTRRPIRLDPREHISSKPNTILVPPPGNITSASPTAPQAEKPHPTETPPDETPVSSSLSIPTTHQPSDARSKHTTISTTYKEAPPAYVESTRRIPKKSPIPVERRIIFFTPATSPTTAEKPSRTGADKPRIGDASLPSEATEIDLPTKSKPSSSRKASSNLHMSYFYEASRHTDEAEPYTEPTSPKPSEMLDEISETDGPSNAIDHAESSPRSAKEGSDRLRASGFWTENTVPNADTQDKKSVRYTERTPQRPVGSISSRATDQRVTYTSPGKPRSSEAHQKLQSEQWHATAGLSNLKGETDDSVPLTQQTKPSKDVQDISSQDSEQASTHPLAQEPVSMDEQLAQGPERTTRTPYTDQRRDVSSMLWQRADVQGIAEKDKESSDQGDAVRPPYARKDAAEARRFPADRRKDAPLPTRVRDDTQAIPLYDDDYDDTNQEARETASAPRRTRAQDPYDTSEGTSSTSQPLNAPHDAFPPPKQATSEGPYARKDVVEARRFPADHRKDAPLPKRVRNDTQATPLYDDDDDTNQEAREIASAPRRTRARDPYDTSEGISSRSQPVNAPHDAVPPPKQATSEGPYARKDAVEARRFPAEAITKQVPSSDAHHDTRKIQHVTLANIPPDDSPIPDRDSVPSAQQSSSSETSKDETIVAAAGPTLPTTVGKDAQGSRRPIKAERTPSVYQEDHLVARDSHEQPQTLPTGGKADGSTPKRQQDPEEKSSTPAPPRARVRDDHPTEETFKGDTKGVPPLLGKEPTSQVQRATEPSTIDQWQRTSVPLQGTPNSGDDVLGGSTIDQKPTPMSQQSIPGARGASEVVEKEQRMRPPARPRARTPDVLSAPSSFSAANTAERDGEPVQMQAPTLHTQGAQPPESTQAQSPFDALRDSVSTQDVPTDALDETDVAKPTSTEGKSPAPTLKAQLAEEKFAPSDKKLARAARPTSTEGMAPTAGPVPTSKAQLSEQKFVPSDLNPEKPQTIFRQEVRPSAPITKQVPSSDAHHDTRKIQQVTLDNFPTDDSSITPFPSPEQATHAPQAFPSKKDRAPAPGTKDSTASNTQIASENVQEAIPDNDLTDELTVPFVSSGKQGSYAGSSTEPHEGSSPDAHGAADDKDITKYPSRQAPVLPDSAPADSYVHPTSGSEVFPSVKKSAPSDQDSIQSAQQPSPETRKEETIVAAAGPTLPRIVGKNTQAQDITRSSAERPFFVEPTKENGIVAASDQTNKARPIIRERGITPAPDKQRTPFDLRASELAAKPPTGSQEQVHGGNAYEQREGPTPDVSGAVDEKMPLPSSQAQNSDVRPDSAPIGDDAHRTSADEPARSSVHDSQAHPPAEIQNAPVVFSKKIESPRPPSTDKKFMTSPTTALDAPQDKDRTRSPQLSTSIASPIEETEAQDTQSDKPEKISPNSAPTSDDALRRSVDGPAPSSLRNSQAQPPAGTQNVPTVFSGKVESSRPPSIAQELMTPVTSPVTAPDTPQDKDRTRSPQLSPSVVSPIEETEARDTGSNKPEKIMPSSAPANDDALRRSVDGPAPSSLRNSQAQPPAGTQNVPTIFSGKMESQRPPSTDQKLMTSPTIALDAPQDKDRTRSPQVSPSVVSPIEETEARDTGSDKPEKIGPNSAPANDDALPRSVDGPAPSSLRDSQAQPPAGTKNVPAVFSGKTESPRPPSTGQELTNPMTSPTTAPDTPQDKDRTWSPQLSPSVVSSIEETDALDAGSDRPEKIRPSSAPSSDDALRTSDIGPGTSSLRDSLAQPPAGTVNVPTVFSEKIESPRPPSTDQKLLNSPRTSLDAPQDKDRTRSPQLSPSVVSPIEETEARDIGSDKPEKIRPSSSPTNDNPLRRSVDGPAPSSLRDSQAQPPTGTQNVPTVFSGKIVSPRSPSTDQQPTTPMTSPITAPDTPQDKDRTQSPQLSPSVAPTIEETEARDAGSDKPEEIRPNSAPSSDDALRTSGNGPATSSLRHSQAQPPAGPDNVSTVFSEKIDSPRPPSTDKKLMTSPKTALNAPQDKDRTLSPQLSPSIVSPIEETEARDTGSDKPEKIKPNSAPANDAAVRRGIDGSALSSLRDSQSQPPVFSGKIGSPRPPSTDQELTNPMISPTTAPDTRQDKDRTRSPRLSASIVSPIEETEARDTGSDKPEEIRPNSAQTSDDALQTSVDGPAPSSLRDSQAQPPAGTQNAPAVFSEKIESPRQPSTDQNVMTRLTSPTPAPDATQGGETKAPTSETKKLEETDLTSINKSSTRQPQSETSNKLEYQQQPSQPNESMQATGNQQLAGQAVFQPTQDNNRQIDEPERQDTATDDPREKNGASQRPALEQQQGGNVPRVERESVDMNNSSKPGKDAAGSIQAGNEPVSTPEEPRQQAQPEGKTRGGGTKAPPASKTEQPEERDLP